LPDGAGVVGVAFGSCTKAFAAGAVMSLVMVWDGGVDFAEQPAADTTQAKPTMIKDRMRFMGCHPKG